MENHLNVSKVKTLTCMINKGLLLAVGEELVDHRTTGRVS